MEKTDRDTDGNTEKEESASAEKVPTPMEYFKSARAFQKQGRQKEAYSLLMQAMLHHPDDPVLLSIYGSLLAIVDKKYKSGVDACRKALDNFKPKDTASARALYPMFYLNLGKAYLAGGKKREGISAFQKGLEYDKRNSELKNEMKQLGTRKNPPLAFLDRSNPINILLGKLLHRK